MKTLKQLAASSFLSLLLVSTVFGGDMPGPGFAQTGQPTASTEVVPASSGPASGTSETIPANAGIKATPNLIDEATIFAINLLTSIW